MLRFFKKQPAFICFCLLVVGLLSLSGCVSDEDTSLINRDMARMETDINRIKKDVSGNKNAISNFDKQKYADLESQADETKTRLDSLDERTNDILQRLNALDRRIVLLQKSMDKEKKKLAAYDATLAQKKAPPPVLPVNNDVTGAESAVEVLYNSAYKNFTQGNYKQARQKFRIFLKKYPKTIYSDNARFWIGETYFYMGDFENAILEYEKVMRSYPRGDKVSSALLKEGMAFYKLGDRTDGRLVLKKLIKKFPRTDQARIAKRLLKKHR